MYLPYLQQAGKSGVPSVRPFVFEVPFSFVNKGKSGISSVVRNMKNRVAMLRP